MLIRPQRVTMRCVSTSSSARRSSTRMPKIAPDAPVIATTTGAKMTTLPAVTRFDSRFGDSHEWHDRLGGQRGDAVLAPAFCLVDGLVGLLDQLVHRRARRKVCCAEARGNAQQLARGALHGDLGQRPADLLREETGALERGAWE